MCVCTATATAAAAVYSSFTCSVTAMSGVCASIHAASEHAVFTV